MLSRPSHPEPPAIPSFSAGGAGAATVFCSTAGLVSGAVLTTGAVSAPLPFSGNFFSCNVVKVRHSGCGDSHGKAPSAKVSTGTFNFMHFSSWVNQAFSISWDGSAGFEGCSDAETCLCGGSALQSQPLWALCSQFQWFKRKWDKYIQTTSRSAETGLCLARWQIQLWQLWVAPFRWDIYIYKMFLYMIFSIFSTPRWCFPPATSLLDHCSSATLTQWGQSSTDFNPSTKCPILETIHTYGTSAALIVLHSLLWFQEALDLVSIQLCHCSTCLKIWTALRIFSSVQCNLFFSGWVKVAPVPGYLQFRIKKCQNQKDLKQTLSPTNRANKMKRIETDCPSWLFSVSQRFTVPDVRGLLHDLLNFLRLGRLCGLTIFSWSARQAFVLNSSWTGLTMFNSA